MKNENHKYYTRSKKRKVTSTARPRRMVISSSSESSSSSDEDQDMNRKERNPNATANSNPNLSPSPTPNYDQKMDVKEYRKFLSEAFPSKYMQEKAKNTPVGLTYDEDEEDEDDEEVDTDYEPPRKKKVTNNPLYTLILNQIQSQLGEAYADEDEEDAYEDEEDADADADEDEYKDIKCKNVEKYRKLLNKKKSEASDSNYFQHKMSIDQQTHLLGKVEELQSYTLCDKPQQIALLESDIPISMKASAFRRLNTLNTMDPGANEYHKLKNWVDTFMQIPFNQYKNLNVSIEDGVDKCHEFMENAKEILDKAVYGLNDAKLQIMQMIGQWIVNPGAIGTAIAIKGPPGTGKTTLVKDGISKILNRDFAFIPLGGATDSSFLEGHSYTYEGSIWGKIVDILIKCKSMNPVIYFDELDKVSDTAKGEEIIGILTHLIDTTQNSKFHDKYFSEVEFDLSRCLFIFSYNDESKVNPILKDRMYRIQTKGYTAAQKLFIAKDYLIPAIQSQVKFNNDDVVIPDETITSIINNHTEKEDGVRNLKRCLEIIYTKLNLYRLMKPDANLFESDLTLRVEFPFNVTLAVLDKLIKKEVENTSWVHMYS